MRGLACLFQRASDQRGSLDIFVACGMVLPVLCLTLFGGWGAIHLATLATELQGATEVGAEAAAIDGGVTPGVIQDVRTALTGTPLAPLAGSVSVSGTAAPVTWGGLVRIQVSLPLTLEGFPWTLMGLDGRIVTLGGTSYVSSNLVPSGP